MDETQSVLYIHRVALLYFYFRFILGADFGGLMMKKTKQLNIRIDEADYEKIQQIANDSNRTVSELLRDHIGKVTVKDSALDRQRNVHLNRINSNLNMIAKWVNTHKELADVIRVTELLISIQRGVGKL